MDAYERLANGFDRVRRAWRRNAFRTGLCVLGVWLLALLGGLVLLNRLFDLHPAARLALSAGAMAVWVGRLWRDLLEPLRRPLDDRRLALYLEERLPECEGALMAAAEFGRDLPADAARGRWTRTLLAAAVERLDAVDVEAVTRSRRRIGRHPAGWGLVAGWVLGLAVFPPAVGEGFRKALNPWYRPPPTQGDETGHDDARLLPLVIALTRDDQPVAPLERIPRGAALNLKAHLNRAPLPGEAFPVFRYRVAAEPSGAVPAEAEAPEAAGDGDAWRETPMRAIEEVHGYAATFPDLDEAMEFQVRVGTVATAVHRIEPVDPFGLAGIRLAVTFPEYLGRPPEERDAATADVAAVAGSRVRLRVAATAELADGRLAWSDGGSTAMTPDPDDPKARWAEFDLTADARFRFELRDMDGRRYASPVPALARALPDAPPELAMEKPVVDVAVHPLGQLTLVASLEDDWGLRDAELVLVVGQGEASRRLRRPLTLRPPPDLTSPESAVPPTVATVREVFRLETLEPPPKPGDMITYHVEATDRKGQRAATDVFFLFVTPFETWSAWNPANPVPPGAEVVVLAPLEKFVAAAWHLRQERPRISPGEYRRRCEALARKLEYVDPVTGRRESVPFLEALL